MRSEELVPVFPKAEAPGPDDASGSVWGPHLRAVGEACQPGLQRGSSRGQRSAGSPRGRLDGATSEVVAGIALLAGSAAVSEPHRSTEGGQHWIVPGGSKLEKVAKGEPE